MKTLGRLLVPALAGLLALTGCGTGPAGSRTRSGGDRLQVVAAFYPLALAARLVGGEHVEVTDLTPPGTEAHDRELTARQVAQVSDADLVVHLAGLAPAVDAAVRAEASARAVDVAPAARLDLHLEPASVGVEDHHDHEAHAHDHGAGATDPHFWLDPQRYAGVVRALAQQMAAADPAHRADYEAGASRAAARLDALAAKITAGLASCTRRDLVTSHAAFGYLADRARMHQVPIAGLSPEHEPEPATLTAIASFVRRAGVRTVYTEPLVSPRLAQTVARSAGVATAVLDPVEGITASSPGTDYFSVMEANLATLRRGQGCA